MKRIIICNTSRNHLRFIIPIVRTLQQMNYETILLTNANEIFQDDLCEIFGDLEVDALDINSYYNDIPDLTKESESFLVTTGSSSIYHKIEYEACKISKCKTFAIQHGLSQEGITRIPEISYSADHVLTWVNDEHVIKNAKSASKFISVGVPDHEYTSTTKIENSKIFFFGRCFDAIDDQDIKLDVNKNSFWSGIYTKKWKDETLDQINRICDTDEPCYFVRHPGANEKIHSMIVNILKRKNKFLIDNDWLKNNNIKRHQLFSMCDQHYVTYPSSCFIDCILNQLDYQLFVDYNGNVDVLNEKSLKKINATNDICKILTT
jgi:hypothetical protein